MIKLREMKAGCWLLVALLVTACGGGGDGDSATAAPQNPGPGGTNAPPTIQGAPQSSVVAGQSYSFRPAANDPDGDALTFSVTNLPRWATFNTSNGTLSGTPASADVGTYSGITVSVSDGKANASLAAFAISVTDTANGMATVSWTPPTQNTDGSTLTNLAGYRILYGRSANDLSQTVSLTNPSLSTYIVENLSAGVWYFAVAAVNSRGDVSAPSGVASKTI